MIFLKKTTNTSVLGAIMTILSKAACLVKPFKILWKKIKWK
tara:strand:- start:214 stop:336 length:123 start_codon:yes stop_codon:yes gene_type:complete